MFPVTAILLISCGIEDFMFLHPVPSGNIVSVEFNHRVTVLLPNIDTDEYYYFTNFAIYYRIYVSDEFFPTIQRDNMSALNPTLLSDFNFFLQYTDTEDPSSSSMGILFRNRNYYRLMLQSSSMDTMLSQSSMGKTISLDFITSSPQSPPALVIDGVRHDLMRSNGNRLFTPVPENRLFFNTPELHDTANLTSTINADVVGRTNLSAGGDHYTYTAMYIVATGIDSSFTPLYSNPTFLGVFLLPNP